VEWLCRYSYACAIDGCQGGMPVMAWAGIEDLIILLITVMLVLFIIMGPVQDAIKKLCRIVKEIGSNE